MIIMTLKAARVNCNLTLVDAAKLLGVNKDALSRIERDSSNISRLLCKKMVQLYTIPEENLFFGDINNFPLTKKQSI